MSRIKTRYLLLSGFVIVSLAAVLFAFARPLPVDVVGPGKDVAVEVFGLGTVEARVLSEIGFEVGAALVELHADQGDHVAQGEVLARIHSADQQARLAKAAAGVLNAEAAVKKAEAAVTRARAILAQKEQSNERKQALLKSRTVSTEVAEEAQLDRDVAAAELAVAIGDAEVARAALEDARAQREYESVVLEQHVLRAPYPALVVQRHKELGAVLSAGEPLFTLVAPESVWARAYVDETRAGGIRLNQAAEIHLRSLPGQVFRGQVARIDIESDRVSEERRVYVTCENCPERFHLGEQVEVFITTAVLEQALLVPETAIEGFDGMHGAVWTVEDGELKSRRAEFGQHTLDARHVIVDGVPQGAQIVTTLRPGLREGRSARASGNNAP